jgi:protein kinase-like protein
VSLEDSDPSSLDAAPALPPDDEASEGESLGYEGHSEDEAPRFAWKVAIATESEPEEIGPYRLVELLGKGAQGKVYRAHDPRAGRDVALKVLQRAGEAARARFRREGEATASLNHPGIVRVHEAGEFEGSAYVAYELVEGAHDLKGVLRSEERPSPLAVAGWVAEIARALGYAHERGVVHRDLKPENVLVDLEGRLRVVDFGLARVHDGTRLTESLASVGTPYYMSPEQIRGDKEIGAAADVWALGVLLYEGLTGDYPCRGATMVELGARVLSGQIEPPRARAPETPGALEEVCLKALRVDPSERFSDGQAMAEALEAALQSGYRAPKRGWSARLWWALPLALLTALVLAPLRTPTQRLTAPPSPELFARALRAGDWELAQDLARRSLQPAVWEARLAAERGRAAPDLGLQLEASGVSPARAAEVAALCSARAAYLRGERPLSALRAGAARWQQRPQWTLARAELLLSEARPREALDVLESAPLAPVTGGAGEVEGLIAARILDWCDGVRLRQALRDLLARPPRLGSEAWREAPAGWGRGARTWLLREGLAFEAWATRARERPYLPKPRGEPAVQALSYLRAAKTFGSSPELRSAIAALDSSVTPPAGIRPEGTIGAAGLRGAARAALSRGAPREALELLGRIDSSPGADPWRRRARGSYASAELRGRAYLSLGEPARAAEALQGADPLSVAVQRSSSRAARKAGLERVAREREAALRILQGKERARARSEVARIRGAFKHGTAPLDQVEEALALDPLYDMAYATRSTARLLMGESGVEEIILVGEAWPQHAPAIHREVFSVWTEGSELGHLRRELLPGIRARSSPLGRAIVAALALEARGGDAAAALQALDHLEEHLDDAPGLQAARCARAFLLVRAGRLNAAEAELAWLETLQPTQGWTAFVRGLLLAARRRAGPIEVVAAFRRAGAGGFKTFREATWAPELYPELRSVLNAPRQPFERFLQSQGWSRHGGF